MEERFSRTALLVGQEAVDRLARARVAVFGVGGVGGYVVEALARSGIGTLDLVDDDTVSLSNLNRQILATERTIGRDKVEVAKERVLDINPDAVVNTWKMFYLPETAGQFDFTRYDYVVDAIDTVTGKLMLVCQAQEAGTPIISCMGAGNKMEASMLEVADIFETSVCPLAKVMRRELKKRGIEHLKVVYSKETPLRPADPEEPQGQEENVSAAGKAAAGPGQDTAAGAARQVPHARRSTPGSTAFVPGCAGLIMAGEVIKDLLKIRQGETDL